MYKTLEFEENVLLNRVKKPKDYKKIKLSSNMQMLFCGQSPSGSSEIVSSVYNEEKTYRIKSTLKKEYIKYNSGYRIFYAPKKITNHKFGQSINYKGENLQIAVTYDYNIESLDILLKENEYQTIPDAKTHVRSKFDNTFFEIALRKSLDELLKETKIPLRKLVEDWERVENKLRNHAKMPSYQGIVIDRLKIVYLGIKSST